MNLKPGMEFAIELNGQLLVLKRFVSAYPDWRTMQGMAKGSGSLTEALMEEVLRKKRMTKRGLKVVDSGRWWSRDERAEQMRENCGSS